MKAKKSERTKKKILDTFYTLAETGSLPTVGEICARMDICVSTFYCHFTGVKEILYLESEQLQNKLVEMNRQIFPQRPYVMTKDKMAQIVSFAQTNRRESLLLLRPDLKLPYREFLEQQVYESVETALAAVPAPRRRYDARFISEGIIEAISEWLYRQDVPLPDFVESVFRLVNAAIQTATAS